MSFSLANAVAGLGAGMAQVGTEDLKAQIEAQRQARLNEYAQALQEKRAQQELAMQGNQQKFSSGESEKDRASRSKINAEDNQAAFDRTRLMTDTTMAGHNLTYQSQQEDRAQRKPLVDAQTGETQARTGLLGSQNESEKQLVQLQGKKLQLIQAMTDETDPVKKAQYAEDLQLLNGKLGKYGSSAADKFVSIKIGQDQQGNPIMGLYNQRNKAVYDLYGNPITKEHSDDTSQKPATDPAEVARVKKLMYGQ